jgi:5'-nucleotidase
VDKPLILLTNDDGIQAPGLMALASALEGIGRVVVVAPERERSAVSHAISLHKPLRLHEVAPGRYACSGTPTDCVYIAMHHVLEGPPSLVVSGINAGANLGDDVSYSGTVGAAMEALLMGAPAVAFSTMSRTRFEGAAQVARRICLRALAEGVPEGTLVNVNFPGDVTVETPWRLTALGRRNYGRQVTRSLDPRGRPYYWIGGAHLGFEEIEGSDCNAVRDGFVSLTPVHLRFTADHAMAPLARWLPTQTPGGDDV